MKWFDMGTYPVHVGYTSSVRDLKKLEKDHDCDMELIPDSVAQMSHFLDEEKWLVCIIYYKPSEEASFPGVAGLISHEVAHVVQAMWRHLSEESPGDEAEAYIFQFLVEGILTYMVKKKLISESP